MNLALHNLEEKLFKELQEIKKLLTQLQTRKETEFNTKLDTESERPDPEYSSTYTPLRTRTSKSTTPKPIQFKELKGNRNAVESRESEVRKLNNTLLTDEELKIFSYYWKLENFSDKILNLDQQDEESYIFTILGKPLRIKASFNHMKRNFLYLKLESAKFDLRDKFQSIVMDTTSDIGSSKPNTIFKEIREAFHLVHKISILDQVGCL